MPAAGLQADERPSILRVLIVDEHLLYAEALSVLLREQGMHVVGVAGDGRQAIADAAELRPDVVLMDIELPLIDGFAATRWIRQRLPETRVVVMTALVGEDHAERAASAGAVACIRKFCPASELLDAIEGAY